MKIKIIYNPVAGKNKGLQSIKNLSDELLKNGHLLHRFATGKARDAFDETEKAISSEYELIIAAGGDGTINEVASALAKNHSSIPLGIFQFGTVNDFATHLNITNDPIKFAKMVEKMNVIPIDLGKANGSFFINVAAGGSLTNVAHETPKEMKAVFGRNAYYLNIVKDLTEKGLCVTNFTIIADDIELTDDFYLFLVSNSPSVGGFSNLAPEAEIQDGLLDCVFVKESSFISNVEVFIGVLTGDHVDHDSVLYFKTKNIKIINNSKKDIEYDIDGEYGGKLPLEIEVVPSAINIII
jgi:diacylglycerol kinase (ATP)